jgi:putative DNA primase/helicase
VTTTNDKRNNASTATIRSHKPNPLTSHVEILGKGASKHGHRFTKFSVEESGKTVVIRHDNFERNTICQLLNQDGADLLTLKSQNELMKRIEDYPRTPTFDVAEEIGLFGDYFILPDRTIPALPDKMEICLNDIPVETRSKYKTAGTRTGWLELARYAIGNSRMMFAFALNFVGPVSALWPPQFVAFQFTARASSGKSAIAAVSTSTWGWDPNLSLGNKYGFGTSWNTTVNELEAICPGYNHTILFLDETGAAERKPDAPVDTLDAVMRLDGQMEKGRKNAVGPRKVWSMPILSTSNVSVPQMAKARQAKEKNKKDPRIFCDRLIDIPPPHRVFGTFEDMFEDLYGFQDNGKFSKHLKTLAAANHGLAARAFVRRILKKRAEDPQELEDFLDARATEYEEEAKTRIVASALVRVHNKFATIYAAGRLAIRAGILPFKGKDLLEAILTCEQDHVRFISEELGGVVQPQRNGIEILRAHIKKTATRLSISISKGSLRTTTIKAAQVTSLSDPTVSPHISFQRKSCRKLCGAGEL